MLTREQILEALAALDAKLASRDARAEIALIGGAVMVLAYRARLSTKDVTAIFSPTTIVWDVPSVNSASRRQRGRLGTTSRLAA